MSKNIILMNIISISVALAVAIYAIADMTCSSMIGAVALTGAVIMIVGLLFIIMSMVVDGDDDDVLSDEDKVDLIGFVSAVFGDGIPPSKSNWVGGNATALPSGRTYTWEMWRENLITPCVEVGIMGSHVDARGRRLVTPAAISVDEALMRLVGENIIPAYLIPSPTGRMSTKHPGLTKENQDEPGETSASQEDR